MIFPQSQDAVESCHKEIKKYIYNKIQENKKDCKLLNSLREITNIHNNKKHSTIDEILRDITDLSDHNYILKIQESMKKVILKIFQ